MNQRIQLSDHFTTSRILRFAASPIIMMVFTSIYSVVDGFFVSNFAGKQAFAAVNLIMPFLQAFGCIGFMLGTGGSALVAMTLGTGNKKRANELFSMLVCATAVLGVIFTVVALLVLRPAAVLLGPLRNCWMTASCTAPSSRCSRRRLCCNFCSRAFSSRPKNPSWAFSLPWQPA